VGSAYIRRIIRYADSSKIDWPVGLELSVSKSDGSFRAWSENEVNTRYATQMTGSS
jgi:hypothetical protein